MAITRLIICNKISIFKINIILPTTTKITFLNNLIVINNNKTIIILATTIITKIIT